ncbi:MAG: hypothetical protein OEY36_13875 [Gammaproteobacteria bacterium]|nr:hypothetical protein [Gammaproteobacteria bacterium]
MSQGIQLSEEMITKLIDVISEYDAEAKQDRIVVLQYLAAINGYLSADYPGPDAEREELLQHLTEFTQHVCNERVQSKQNAPSPQQAVQPDSAKGKSVPTDDPAVGIWKPE